MGDIEALKRQLFIGMVVQEIGFDRTMYLLREVNKTFPEKKEETKNPIR